MQYRKMAFYIRLSLEDADLKTQENKQESNSISNQRKLLWDYYHEHPTLGEYEVVEFCDDGYSGTNFQRPQFIKMMEEVRQREIQCIVVKDLSRFGREYLEVGAYLELILPLFGTRFISVNDNFDSHDYIGTTGGMELALHNLINGMYSRDLSVKMRSAIKVRNRRGQYCGGYAFYGYTVDPKNKHKILVDEGVKPIVERIFQECIEGRSTAQIAQGLNADQIPPPVARKKQLGGSYNGRMVEGEALWLAGAVRKILNDERYTGKMVTGKRESVGIRTGKTRSLPKEQWIVVDNTHEAIISEDTFLCAADSLKKRIKTINKNTAGDRSKNLFVCGYCGRKLQKTGGRNVHLFCLKARTLPESECAKLHVDLEQIEDKTLQTIRILARILVEKKQHNEKKMDNKIEKLKNEIDAIKRRQVRLQNGKLDLYEDYRAERITKERFLDQQKKRQEENDQLQKELEEQTAQLDLLQNQVKQMEQAAEISQHIEVLGKYEPAIIGKFVKRVSVYTGNRIEIEMAISDSFMKNILTDRSILAS